MGVSILSGVRLTIVHSPCPIDEHNAFEPGSSTTAGA